MRLCPKPIPASWVEFVGSDRDRLIVYDLNGNTASMTVLAFLATCSVTPDTELLTGRVGHAGVEETRQDERRRPPFEPDRTLAGIDPGFEHWTG